MSTRPARRLFGTDGIRGNTDADLTPDLVRDIGRAVATAVARGVIGAARAKPKMVIGRDTRVSGPKLEQAFLDGACSVGAEVLVGGVLPTAAVAYLTGRHDADVGVVVSASHNPPSDNGIKLFGPGGWKLPGAVESQIESFIGDASTAGTARGTSTDLRDAADSYIDHLVEVASHDVRNVRVVLDCANGAASAVAPAAMERVGIDAIVMNASTDGGRINDGCGALHPEVVSARAAVEGAIGATFDGDADRVLLCDELGRLVDGDAILALLASRMKREGALGRNAIVSTVMANQALRAWCTSEGIELVETAVGDRYVLEAMRERNITLGGEQSGHIVCLDRSTTGDGILVALEVLDLVAETGRPLSDLVPFEPFPQVLVNIRTSRRDDVGTFDRVRTAIDRASERLGTDGRVLVRPSGTEPLVRVMVEATDAAVARDVAEDVAGTIRAELEASA